LKTGCRFVLVSAAALAACRADPGADPESFASAGRPVTNGTPDEEPAHRAVVAVLMGGGLCSGTLVAPRVVLTAGHCVERRGPQSFRVGFGDEVGGGMKYAAVRRVLLHPRYTSEPTYDLGLLELASAPPVAVTPIAPLPAAHALGAADVGKPLEFSGYGETETGAVGRRMHVTGSLGFVCDSNRMCDWSGMPAAPHSICYDQQPGGPCSGDSGGPSLVSVDGATYVAGVTSYGDEECAQFGCSTKVDAFDSFIADFVKGTVGTACGSSADCLQGNCRDGVCCDGGCEPGCGSCSSPASPGTCEPAPEGTACDDRDACTAGDACRAGRCRGSDAVTCPVGDPCRVEVRCEPSSGRCVSVPREDGFPCCSGNLCDLGGRCVAGVCTAAAHVSCGGVQTCRAGECNPADGTCRYADAPDGTACDDGACRAGVCTKSGCGCAAGAEAWPGLLALAAARARRRR